jgi:hypothetical protein
LEQKPATYHRAEAARARKLLAEATTPRLKEHLEAEVARHEQLAAEVERASEPGADTVALSSETPGK